MLSYVNMILFLKFSSENEVERFYLFSSVLYDLSFEIEPQLALRIEASRFFIFDMKLRKEGTLE